MHFLLSSFLFPILTNNEPTHAKYSRKAIDPPLPFISLITKQMNVYTPKIQKTSCMLKAGRDGMKHSA